MTIEMPVVCIVADKGPKVRNQSHTHGDAESSYGSGLWIDNLRLRAYWRQDHGWYGFDLCYQDVFCADLRACEAMTATLRKIRRALDKSAAEYGSPQDLDTFVKHAAKAIGVESIVQRAGDSTGWSYDHSTWTVRPVTEQAYCVQYAALEGHRSADSA